MNKAYERINWENYPSENTALNEANLNKMDAALNEVDNRVVAHETTKLDVATANSMVRNVSFNERSGIFTITYLNGSTKELDTKLEKIATNFVYDEERQKLILTLIDGTTQEIDMSALVTQYEFENSAYIKWTVVNGKVKAEIINGSITADKLQPNFLADVTLQANSAKTSEQNAKVSEENAKQSEINAKNYADSAEPVASTANGLNPTLDNSTSAKIISFLGDGETIQTQSKYLTELTATDGGVKTNKITCKKGDVIILSLGEARGLEVFEEHSDGTTGKIVKFGTETTWTHTASINTVAVQLLIVGGTIDDNITITVNGSEYAPPSPTNEVPIYGVGESRNEFDKDNANIINGYLEEASNTIASDAGNTTVYIPCEPNKAYTVSKAIGKRFGVAYTKELPAAGVAMYGYIADYSGKSITIKTGSEAAYLAVWVHNANVTESMTATEMLATIQIEKGETATPYKAFGKHSLKVKTTGANILNYEEWKKASIARGSAVWENNGVTLTATGNDCYTSYDSNASKIPCKTGQKIILSWEHSGSGGNVYMFKNGSSSGTNAIRASENANKIEYTVEDGIEFVSFRFGVLTSGTTASYKNIMVTFDTIPSKFVPSKKTKANIPLSSPLYEGDYILYNMDGSGELVRKMASVVFDGSESWSNWTSTGLNQFYTIKSNALHKKDKVRVHSSHFIGITIDKRENNYETIYTGLQSNVSYINVNTQVATTVDEWKAWLAENPVTVVYELAEPTVTPLTAEQIAEFEKLRSFDGTTHVTCEAESEIQYFYDSVSGKAVAMVASKANTSAELPIGSVIMIEEQNTEKPKYGEWSYLFTQTLTGESGGTPRAVSVNVYKRRA